MTTKDRWLALCDLLFELWCYFLPVQILMAVLQFTPRYGRYCRNTFWLMSNNQIEPWDANEVMMMWFNTIRYRTIDDDIPF